MFIFEFDFSVFKSVAFMISSGQVRPVGPSLVNANSASQANARYPSHLYGHLDDEED